MTVAQMGPEICLFKIMQEKHLFAHYSATMQPIGFIFPRCPYRVPQYMCAEFRKHRHSGYAKTENELSSATTLLDRAENGGLASTYVS